eukprot:scaffold329699_cov64-Tisochrysis_lutea.AAC.1
MCSLPGAALVSWAARIEYGKRVSLEPCASRAVNCKAASRSAGCTAVPRDPEHPWTCAIAAFAEAAAHADCNARKSGPYSSPTPRKPAYSIA